MSKLKTDERPQKMMNKGVLRNLMSIVSKNTDITKIFNVGRNLAVRCIKFQGLTDIPIDPEDYNEIAHMLYEVHKFHKNFGYYYAACHLLKKWIKVK